MVILVKNEILEIAKRRLSELSKKNPECRKYFQQLNMQRENVPSSVFKASTIRPTLKRAVFDRASRCTLACVGQSVLDILARRPRLFTFKEAYAILGHCNVDQNRSFVEEIIKRYSIVITGLPQCAEEDLVLAVYFFIEDMFGIQPKIEFCTKLVEDSPFDMTGVVFENIDIKQQIFEKLSILEDSGIEIGTHLDVIWIEQHLNSANSC